MTEETAHPEIEYSALSHIGPVREDNQDSVRLPEGYPATEYGALYGLADGMGGYSHGELASSLALEKLFQIFYSENTAPGRRLKRGIEAANLSVYQTAQRLGVGRMGTTLTAAHVAGNQLSLAHIGDSRAYLVRDNMATCLTSDHTTVGELVRMKALSPDKVRTHDQRSVLTRCIGLSLFIRPDIVEMPVQDGDCLILCSDGLWSVIEDDEFARVAGDIRKAEVISQALIDLALDRETDDNISVVVIDIQHVAPSLSGNSRGWWPAFLRGEGRVRSS